MAEFKTNYDKFLEKRLGADWRNYFYRDYEICRMIGITQGTFRNHIKRVPALTPFRVGGVRLFPKITFLLLLATGGYSYGKGFEHLDQLNKILKAVGFVCPAFKP